MFKSLRWRLTLWFLLLTTIVYVISALCGMWLFRAEMTRVIDDELYALVDELRPAIAVKDGKPDLQEWAKTAPSVPFKLLPTIQLYDANTALLEEHGPSGVPILFSGIKQEVKAEDYHIRVLSLPLHDRKKLVGYLQLELSLRNRERATREFGTTMGLIFPFLVVALGIAGYLFSSKAARPVEDSFNILQRFMTDAGHELSTPISIIQANAEAMEVEHISETSNNRVAVIMRSTERMANLVKDLMLLSKMESPQVTTNRIPLDLEKLVRAAVEEFEELFRSRSIALNVSIHPASIIGDYEAIRRLVNNLMHNALRYTESPGTVTVGLEQTGRMVKLTVSDTGIGIPTESLPLIFDRFYRVDKSRSRAQGGSGLGLSIARAITDAHKGRIEVQSKVGAGSTFTIIFPARV